MSSPPVATAARDGLPAGADPAGDIWSLHGQPGPLLFLADLPGQLTRDQLRRLRI